MRERSVVTRFEAKVDGYLAGVAKMRNATTAFAVKAGQESIKHKADWDKVGKAALVGGAAIGVAVLGAAKAYMEFEASMSRVAAVADATAQQQKQLSEAAIKAGQDTVFSATEAAQAEAELAKAGVQTADILGGALRGSLDLAAAGGLDLAKSAEIAAQAMNIFDKGGRDVSHIADVLTAGANKSAAGVDDLGMALSQGGLLAKQTGLTLEDTVGVLSAFADNALKGSDAGTSLKTMLQRLTPQSEEQAKAMDALGLSFYDANGQFVGIAESAGRMQQAFKDLTPEQRNSALATIFGSDAVRGANILMEQGEAGIRKYIAAVDDQGAAQRMAARQTDNLKGDFEQLRGTIESAFIRGGSGGNDGIRSLVQGLTGLIDRFNELDPATQSWIVKAAAATSGALLLAGGTAKVVTTVSELHAAYGRTALSGSKFTAGLASGAKNAAKLGVALAALAAATSFDERGGIDIDRLTQDLASADDRLARLDQSIARVPKPFFQAADAVNSFGDVLHYTFNPEAIQQFDNSAGKVLEAFSGTNVSNIAIAGDRLMDIDSALARMASSGNAEGAAALFYQLKTEAAGYGKSTDDLLALLPSYADVLDSTAVGAGTAGTAAGELADQTSLAAGATADAATATGEWADSLKAFNSPALDAREAARQFEQAVDDASAALKKNGRSLDINTQKGRDNQAALDGVAQAALDQIGAMQENGASQEELQAKLDTSRDRLITLATKFLGSKEAARKYVEQVLKVPKTVDTKFTANTGPAAAKVDALAAKYQRYDGRTITTFFKAVSTGAPTAPYSTNLSELLGGPKTKKAGGGAVFGAGTATSDSIDAKLSNGEHVLTASDVQKAGGQGAIYRMRAGIQAGVLRFAGGGAVGFADGGEVDWSAILDIVRDVTTADDVRSARDATKSRQVSLKSAAASLATMRRQLAAANRNLAAARRTRGRGDDLAALEKRRQLLAKIEVQEDRVALATSKVTAARKAQATAEKEYKTDRQTYYDRTITAAKSANATSKRFLDNIDRLIGMGFKTLALDLLNQGGPEAENLAEAAVKSAAKAKALESQLSASASNDARRQALLDALEGRSASGEPPALGMYGTRDIGRLTTGSPPRVPITAPSGPVINISGAIDPYSTGRQVERVLQQYTAASGRPIRIEVQQ